MQQNTYTPRFRQRPCGVTLMSIFLMIQGIYLVVVGVFGIIGLVILIFDASKGATFITHGIASFILGILSIIISLGLFSLARWAFWTTVFIAALNLVDSIIILVQTNFTSWTHFINIAFSLVILVYFLFDARVRNTFYS